MRSMKVSIDPRIELLSIIQLFSDYGKNYRPLSDLESNYRKAICDYFYSHRNDPAIKCFSSLVKQGFNFTYPMDFALSLALDLKSNSLWLNEPIQNSTAQSAGGMKHINEFTAKMAEFAQHTDFVSFFKNNTNFYRSIVAEVKIKLARFSVTDVFAAYFGVQYQDYTLILNPLCDAGGYGLWRENEDGMLSAYAVTGPLGNEEGLLRFVGEPEGLCAFIWHEFGHSVINPLTSKHLEELATFDDLFEPIAAQMQEQAYGEWEFCLNEHVVRACVIRLLELQFSAERARELLDYDRARGFYLLDPLLDWLIVYERNLERYANFAEYYPSLLDVLTCARS